MYQLARSPRNSFDSPVLAEHLLDRLRDHLKSVNPEDNKIEDKNTKEASQNTAWNNPTAR